MMEPWMYLLILQVSDSLIIAFLCFSLYSESIRNHKYIFYVGCYEVLDAISNSIWAMSRFLGGPHGCDYQFSVAVVDMVGSCFVMLTGYSVLGITPPAFLWYILLISRIGLYVFQRSWVVYIMMIPTVFVGLHTLWAFWKQNYWFPTGAQYIYLLSGLSWLFLGFFVDGKNPFARMLMVLVRLLQGVAVIGIHGKTLQVERDAAVREHRQAENALEQVLKIVTLDMRRSVEGSTSIDGR